MDTTAPTDLARLLAALDVADLRRRLAALDAERRAVLTLLRAARRKQASAPDNAKGGRADG